jgi:hypothetical protein
MSRAAANTSMAFRSGLANTKSAALTPAPKANATTAVAQRLIAGRPYYCLRATSTQVVKKQHSVNVHLTNRP